MADNLPALVEEQILEEFDKGSPFHRMLGHTLMELGGLDFVANWAEENPTQFMNMLMACSTPPPSAAPQQQRDTGIHIHMPPGLGPGPLDITPVSEQ